MYWGMPQYIIYTNGLWNDSPTPEPKNKARHEPKNFLSFGGHAQITKGSLYFVKYFGFLSVITINMKGRKIRKYLMFVLLVLNSSTVIIAQPGVKQSGEIGISLGPSHYFGDLNTRSRINILNGSGGIFFKKNISNYIATRFSINYARLSYSDKYNTHNQYQYRRNLNFETNIFEMGVQGDFNFYKFAPYERDYNFTPYVTLGLGIFTYDPYTFLDGEKYFLRTMNTEGQGLPGRRKPYGSMALFMPIGVGIKYNVAHRINLGFEVSHRFTSTDYIDDVSSTYAGPTSFINTLNPTAYNPAILLQDRSYERGAPIGIANRQRGYSRQKDQYIMAHLMLSVNLTSYRCPTYN
jgi:hypothetical protein